MTIIIRSMMIAPLLAMFCLSACKKPVERDTLTLSEPPPMLFRTALHDPIADKTLKPLHLEKTVGVKVKYYSGRDTSYFVYQADRDQILQTIAGLPFPRHAVKADTTCYRISFEDLAFQKKLISETEYSASTEFWEADRLQYDAYECLKPPFKHTLLIARHSKQVLHRIERIS